MIKFVAAALWILALTIGTIFYAYSSTPLHEASDEDLAKQNLETLKSDVMSVPIIREGEVRGYFLARLLFTVDPDELRKLKLPAGTLLVDQLYTYLYSNPDLDFSRTDTLDLEAFRSGIKDSLNLRAGGELVHEVLIEQLDFLSKKEIRDNQVRRRGNG